MIYFNFIISTLYGIKNYYLLQMRAVITLIIIMNLNVFISIRKSLLQESMSQILVEDDSRFFIIIWNTFVEKCGRRGSLSVSYETARLRLVNVYFCSRNFSLLVRCSLSLYDTISLDALPSPHARGRNLRSNQLSPIPPCGSDDGDGDASIKIIMFHSLTGLFPVADTECAFTNE